MNSQDTQPRQPPLMRSENPPQADVRELPPDFKANGFWQVDGQKRAGTLRRKGESSPTAYFLVSHPNGKPPFGELTEVAFEFETRDGLSVTGFVNPPKRPKAKDAGEPAVCSEYDPDGKRCEQRRFWKTFCEDHTKAAGYRITKDRPCAGQKKNGEPCKNRAKVNGYCALHGEGIASPETKTYLYEFPITITELVEGPVEKS